MRCFSRVHWFCLHDMVSSVFSIVIGPTMNFRYIARPVTVTRIDRSCPLERVSTPGIHSSNLSSFEHGIEEVENEQEVYGKHHDCYNGDHPVQVTKLVEGSPATEVKVATRYACQAHIVHRPEDEVSTCHCHPKVDIS